MIHGQVKHIGVITKYRYIVADKMLSEVAEFDGKVVTPKVLQDISKLTNLSYVAIKVRAKRHGITVKRAW